MGEIVETLAVFVAARYLLLSHTSSVMNIP